MNRIKSFHWTEKMEFVNLAAMLIVIPIDSGVSLLFSILWMLSVILKNTSLKRWSFFGWHQDKNYHYSRNYYLLIPMMCYWLSYLLSMLWTENWPTGWAEVGELAWFFVLPLTCACTDFRQFSGKLVRIMLWSFVLTLSVLFVVLLSIVVVKACSSAEYSFLWFMMNEDFYHIHHSYMALYILTALAFLYSELVRKEKHDVWQIVLAIVCACCLVLFLLCINSRAGLLCLIILMALCWVHQCFVRKKYRFSLISLVIASLVVVGSHFALPDYFRRLSVTIEQVAHGDKSDGRFEILEKTWMVLKDNMLLGVGAGDRMDELAPYYGSLEDAYCPHNQYLDSWMATGVIGLLSLLAMLIVPLVMALRKHNIFSFLFLLMLMVSLLFESMLERQMGVAFTAVIYIYLLLFFQLDSKSIININFPKNE
ncbi:MAG: O-antigen ligase family protein [Bacteroidales bacterium]|nr:O-antigen ligase family protein [Bacteroidales bacterium]